MAGSKTNLLEQQVLDYVLRGSAPAWDGDSTAKIALFTADPGEAGSVTNECDYTSYARQTVTKATFWNAATADAPNYKCVNAAELLFPECTGGSDTITHWGVMDAAGNLLYVGSLDASLSVSTGIQPRFPAGALVIKEG